MNIQTVYDLAETAEAEGAASCPLWAIGGVDCYLVCIDTGEWYFADTTDHRIDIDDARRLLDVFQIGYL
jgi:hypothetical protein